ncbi:MAG: oxaloacetate decarboxylase [Candidatus Odyssella sp.]|nr:oxaloacetate decarboxylase [Candidatus Odyssella sp.]
MSGSDLRALLAGPPIVVAPGIYDALTALLASHAGFKALYLSGASIAYTRFGRPDLGLVGMDEVAETLMAIRERVGTPIVVDADTGFGNALNVQRTVKRFARAGADAIQLEDQTFPKRCGHLDEKRVVPAAEMVGKIKAALDARPSADVLVVARTDAVGPEGLPAALDRAEAYRDAGADVLFIEALRSDAEIAAAMRRFRDRIPLLANMVEGGKTPMKSAAELQALGFSLAIFPGGTVRFLARGLADYYASLAQHGTTAPMRDRMLDFDGLNALIGTPEMLALGKKYEG